MLADLPARRISSTNSRPSATVEYTFKHALTQDVAYNSLLLQQRKELHRAVGRAIEELYSARLNEHYSELAHHFVSAEDWTKSLEYSTRAGEQSAQSHSNVEAEPHYARALAAASKLPSVYPGALADLHLNRGVVLSTVGRYDEASADYQCALEMARSAGDRTREVLVSVSFEQLLLGDPSEGPDVELQPPGTGPGA